MTRADPAPMPHCASVWPFFSSVPSRIRRWRLGGMPSSSIICLMAPTWVCHSSTSSSRVSFVGVLTVIGKLPLRGEGLAERYAPEKGGEGAAGGGAAGAGSGSSPQIPLGGIVSAYSRS